MPSPAGFRSRSAMLLVLQGSFRTSAAPPHPSCRPGRLQHQHCCPRAAQHHLQRNRLPWPTSGGQPHAGCAAAVHRGRAALLRPGGRGVPPTACGNACRCEASTKGFPAAWLTDSYATAWWSDCWRSGTMQPLPLLLLFHEFIPWIAICACRSAAAWVARAWRTLWAPAAAAALPAPSQQPRPSLPPSSSSPRPLCPVRSASSRAAATLPAHPGSSPARNFPVSWEPLPPLAAPTSQPRCWPARRPAAWAVRAAHRLGVCRSCMCCCRCSLRWFVWNAH